MTSFLLARASFQISIMYVFGMYCLTCLLLLSKNLESWTLCVIIIFGLFIFFFTFLMGWANAILRKKKPHPIIYMILTLRARNNFFQTAKLSLFLPFLRINFIFNKENVYIFSNFQVVRSRPFPGQQMSSFVVYGVTEDQNNWLVFFSQILCCVYFMDTLILLYLVLIKHQTL